MRAFLVWRFEPGEHLPVRLRAVVSASTRMTAEDYAREVYGRGWIVSEVPEAVTVGRPADTKASEPSG